VIAGTALMIKVNDLLTAAPLASATWIVTAELPAAVGPPLICPVAEFSVSPAGKAPAVIVHTSGAVPPLAATVAE
jgi:hypothetical protein